MLKSLHDILEILILRSDTPDECDIGRTDARIKMCMKVSPPHFPSMMNTLFILIYIGTDVRIKEITSVQWSTTVDVNRTQTLVTEIDRLSVDVDRTTGGSQ